MMKTMRNGRKMSLFGLMAILIIGSSGLTAQSSSGKQSYAQMKKNHRQAKTLKAPRGFFSMAPIWSLNDHSVRLMRNNKVAAIRYPISWAEIETKPGQYDWHELDSKVRQAAKYGLQVRPFVGVSPEWISDDSRFFPIHNRYQQRAWKKFLRVLVRRYGRQGFFWRANRNLPRRYITSWQIGNEPNASTFSIRPSAKGYGKWLKISYRTIKRADRRAKVIMAGLYAQFGQGPPVSYTGARFLRMLYRHYPKLNRFFDAVALHPYSKNAGKLPKLIRQLRQVLNRHHGRNKELWITEMGWGSARGKDETVFEKGPKGQARQLRRAYKLLIKNHRHWRLRQVTWFSWSDGNVCAFCDSTGLFYEDGTAKPAWRAFAATTKRFN